MFQGIIGVELDPREASYECGSNCMDHVLVTEGVLRNIKGIEIIECGESIESNYRGCLTDVD